MLSVSARHFEARLGLCSYSQIHSSKELLLPILSHMSIALTFKERATPGHFLACAFHHALNNIDGSRHSPAILTTSTYLPVSKTLSKVSCQRACRLNLKYLPSMSNGRESATINHAF
jgi:hypothetical protein